MQARSGESLNRSLSKSRRTRRFSRVLLKRLLLPQRFGFLLQGNAMLRSQAKL